MQKELIKKLTYVLQNTFHFPEFRPGQLDSIVTLMTENRLLCIQPTGYGKSLLYQLSAMLLNGITLVISPLLALMRDQVDQLNNRFNIPAISLNTDQSGEENFAAQRNIRAGKIRILFMAPEQLESLERFNFLLSLPIELLVVDEAHCISTWGHDFRPSYRQIIKLTRALAEKNPEIKLLALTATANKKTEIDIKEQLTIQHKKIIVQRESMNRPNLRLTVLKASGTAQKLAVIIQLLNSLKGSGLIYCATRENTEIVAGFLVSQGLKAAAYHAGIEVLQKKQIQKDFINDVYPIIVATNALGMGIDKPNLRFIIHFDFPGSITAYYQEVGRCGRDGLPADGILIYDSRDSQVQYYFIDSAQPTAYEFEHVLNTIINSKTPLNLTAIRRETGMHATKLNVILAELIEQEFLEKINQDRTQTYHYRKKSSKPHLDRYKKQYDLRYQELSMMQKYAEHPSQCLMTILREALGDASRDRCQQCSYCSDIAFKITQNKDLHIAVTSWVEKRLTPIMLSKRKKNVAVGVAILDSKLRSPDFISFMRERANASQQSNISDSLMQLIKTTLADLSQHYRFSCIIPIPSRTWSAREIVTQSLAKYLKIPVLNGLTWQKEPVARQGELLNNDQRQHNVAKHMEVNNNLSLPKGTILLMDDYFGSGATMQEAARVLCQYTKNKIVPFAIATVKWRIGKKGMI